MAVFLFVGSPILHFRLLGGSLICMLCHLYSTELHSATPAERLAHILFHAMVRVGWPPCTLTRTLCELLLFVYQNTRLKVLSGNSDGKTSFPWNHYSMYRETFNRISQDWQNLKKIACSLAILVISHKVYLMWFKSCTVILHCSKRACFSSIHVCERLICYGAVV